MNKKELLEQKRIELNNLQLEVSTLEKEIINNESDFILKFREWAKSSQGEHDRWVPDAAKFPLLRNLIINCEIERHRTIDILDYFTDELYCILHDIEETGLTDKEYDKEVVRYLPFAQEIFEGNLKSFVLDW